LPSPTAPESSSPALPYQPQNLADHLGLSTAAIPRVLNAAPAAQSIPKSTQDRIFAAAERLKYRPNLSARTLRNRRSQTIVRGSTAAAAHAIALAGRRMAKR